MCDSAGGSVGLHAGGIASCDGGRIGGVDATGNAGVLLEMDDAAGEAGGCAGGSNQKCDIISLSLS